MLHCWNVFHTMIINAFKHEILLRLSDLQTQEAESDFGRSALVALLACIQHRIESNAVGMFFSDTVLEHL